MHIFGHKVSGQDVLSVATGGLVPPSPVTKAGGQVIKTVSGAGAAKNAAEELQKQAEAGAKQYAPYQAAGQAALGRISDILSGKTKLNPSDIPGYQAGLDAGTSAVERSAVAKGSLGGGTLASLFGFGQQYAGKAFSDYMTQLQGVATMGYNATAGAVGQQNAAAQAKAAGELGQQQAYTNLLGAGLNFAAGGGISGLTSGVSGLFSSNTPLPAGGFESVLKSGNSDPYGLGSGPQFFPGG